MVLYFQLGHLSLCAFPALIILVCWVGLLPIPQVFALHSAQHLACAKLFYHVIWRLGFLCPQVNSLH